MSYSDAVQMGVDGATYREALAKYGLKSLSNLHRLCSEAGVGPRPNGRKKSLPEKAIRAAALVRNGMTYREARARTGAHLSQIAKAVKRGAAS